MDRALPATRNGTNVSVSAEPLASLAARLDARFAALVAQFAAFELRAPNGFGVFVEADDDASADRPEPAVGVLAPRPPAAIMPPLDNTDASNQVARGQNARDGESIEANPPKRLKARNDDTRDRDKAKTGKRHRGSGKQAG